MSLTHLSPHVSCCARVYSSDTRDGEGNNDRVGGVGDDRWNGDIQINKRDVMVEIKANQLLCHRPSDHWSEGRQPSVVRDCIAV